MTISLQDFLGSRWVLPKVLLPFLVLVTLLYFSYTQLEVFSGKEGWSSSQLESLEPKTVPKIYPMYFQQKSGRKVVLLWTPYFSNKNWLPSTDQLQCPVRECDVFTDRAMLNQSSAVLIHWRSFTVEDAAILECNNGSCPVMVLFNMEAPPHTYRNQLAPLNNKIHFTATYRRDSDLFSPYGMIVERNSTWKMPELKEDRALVCWLVSNCHTPSHRESYATELRKYIPVQTYGFCGTGRCPYDQSRECYNWLSKKCKFYLSFENSICVDYLTEKLYYAMMSDMVPVVMGGANYSEYLPPHSYINALDFPNPKSLAKYLRTVGNDQKKYMKYFEWKKTHEAVNIYQNWYCDLCEILHHKNISKIQPHRDVTSWWYKEDCQSYEEKLKSAFS